MHAAASQQQKRAPFVLHTHSLHISSLTTTNMHKNAHQLLQLALHYANDCSKDDRYTNHEDKRMHTFVADAHQVFTQ